MLGAHLLHGALWASGGVALAVAAVHLVRVGRDRRAGAPGLASVLALPALGVMVASVVGLRLASGGEAVDEVARGLTLLLDARELGLYAVAPPALVACLLGALVGVERPSRVAAGLAAAALAAVVALVVIRAALTGDLLHGLARGGVVLTGGACAVLALARRAHPQARPAGVAAGVGLTLLVAAVEVSAGARFWFGVLYDLAMSAAPPEAHPWSGDPLGQGAVALALVAGMLLAWRSTRGWRLSGGAVGFLVGPALLLVASPEGPMDQLVAPVAGEPTEDLALPL